MSEPAPASTRATIALGFIAGMVDVTGWLTLGGLFTAHITGNLVVIAADMVSGRPPQIAPVLAIPVFVVVAGMLAIIVRWLALATQQIEALMYSLQAAFLVVAAAAAFSISASWAPTGGSGGLVAMLAVAAMASQNALLHLSERPVPTTAVMTGNIVQATLSLVTMATAREPARAEAKADWNRTWPLIGGFMSGCCIGAASVSLFQHAAWIVAAAIAVLAKIRHVAARREALRSV